MKKQGWLRSFGRSVLWLETADKKWLRCLLCIGAIILGIGGDNSPWAAGTFYEGAMTYGFATDEIEQAVFANIVSAGYGK